MAHIMDIIRNATERVSMRDPRLTDLIDQSSIEGLLTCLRQLSAQWERYLDHLEVPVKVSVAAYTVPIDRSHGRIGRPRLGIGRDRLEYFVSLSFNWTRIATILGISRRFIVGDRNLGCWMNQELMSVMENYWYLLKT